MGRPVFGYVFIYLCDLSILPPALFDLSLFGSLASLVLPFIQRLWQVRLIFEDGILHCPFVIWNTNGIHLHSDPSLGRIAVSSRLEAGFGVERALGLSLGRAGCLWSG